MQLVAAAVQVALTTDIQLSHVCVLNCACLFIVAVCRRFDAPHDRCRFGGNVAYSLAGVADPQQTGVFRDRQPGSAHCRTTQRVARLTF